MYVHPAMAVAISVELQRERAARAAQQRRAADVAAEAKRDRLRRRVRGTVPQRPRATTT